MTPADKHKAETIERLAKSLEAYHRAGWSWRQIAEAALRTVERANGGQ